MAAPKRSLTERLENMAFMRRGKERELRETYAKRQREREDDAHWVLPAPPPPPDSLYEPIIIVESGYVTEPGALGRQSFGSFNPVVEKRNAAIEQGLDPNTVQPQISVPLADKPAPMLRGPDPDMGFKEPFLAAPKDEPVPRKKSSPPKRKDNEPMIAKRKRKNGMVDESALKKKRRKRNRGSVVD